MSLNPLKVGDLISEHLPEERHAIAIERYVIENHRGSQERLIRKLMLIMARRIKAPQHGNRQPVDASLVTA
jgi:hypothetical protein